MKSIKCLICKDKFTDIEDVYLHMSKEHNDEIPPDFSPQRYYYLLRTGKSKGTCIVCKQSTKWNEVTNKYHRFCDKPSCKEKYREEFKKRMIGKHGQVHLLNDPSQQRKMLANRSISGEYVWSDGKKIPYTGSYELDFLKFLDVFMEFSSSDIMGPSPHTYYYLYEGTERFYIPDFFIPSLGLEIEIKDGGDNPNNHHKIQDVDKAKEKIKDSVLMSQKQFSYIKLTNKKYDTMFDFLMKKKEEYSSNGNIDKPIFILNESLSPDINGSPVLERMGSNKHVSLYHVSESDIDGKVLTPRIPNNFLVNKGFEENKTPRVSFASSIDGCLIGIGQNLKGKVLNVYEPEDYSKIKFKKPTIEEVPDSGITKEYWITTPVKLKFLRQIIVGEAKDKPFKYKYGSHEAETYAWNWSNKPTNVTEGVGDTLFFNNIKHNDDVRDFETIIREGYEFLQVLDKSLEIGEYSFETENVLEAWGKETHQGINRAPNPPNKLMIGFTVKNIDLIFSNAFKDVQKTGNFSGLRSNLLKMVSRCANVGEVNYLRRDLSAGKIMLRKLAENKPEIKKQCLDHITWLEKDYTETLNTKAKELKQDAATESFLF